MSDKLSSIHNSEAVLMGCNNREKATKDSHLLGQELLAECVQCDKFAG